MSQRFLEKLLEGLSLELRMMCSWLSSKFSVTHWPKSMEGIKWHLFAIPQVRWECRFVTGDYSAVSRKVSTVHRFRPVRKRKSRIQQNVLVACWRTPLRRSALELWEGVLGVVTESNCPLSTPFVNYFEAYFPPPAIEQHLNVRKKSTAGSTSKPHFYEK